MPKQKKNEEKKADPPKKSPSPEVSMEELDKKITTAERKLRKLGIEKDIWVKKPIDVDPSFHFFFTKLKNPKGELMLKQHAGTTVRLIKAPPYLKRGSVRHLEELIDFVSLELKKEPQEDDDCKKN